MLSDLPPSNKFFFVAVLEQIQVLLRDHMSDTLINHHANQQLEWNQTIDLQRLVNTMSFTHLNDLNCWKGLRNFDQFNSFAKHSLLTANKPALHISSSSVHPITALPNLDLLVLDDLTSDRPEHPPVHQAHSHDNSSVQSTIHSWGSVDLPDAQDIKWHNHFNPSNH